MHILGLSCGSLNGNSEILLKSALKEAAAHVPGTTISYIRIADASIPSYDLPGVFNPSSGAITPGSFTVSQAMSFTGVIDDRPACIDAILDSDAIVIASPVYTRQAAGVLKYFCDKALGPFVDAAFVEQALVGKKAGDPRFKDFTADERVLKPRVAALIAAGGARSEEWASLSLPSLHQCVFSLHAKVVDQILVQGVPFPGVVLADEPVMARSRQLGRNVASQLGKSFDDAVYIGEEKGSCPHCHLDAIILTRNNSVDCATCGAKGRLSSGEDGEIQVVFLDEPQTSVITMAGKRRHRDEIRDLGMNLGPKMLGLRSMHEEWAKMDNLLVKLPSAKAAVSKE
ncbi:flavoprotein-like protein [Tricladium varicosporioides]|nr:flavoprotein-like protein [Hymenoscyphus varicosporioides]